jgi:hypothetical protein
MHEKIQWESEDRCLDALFPLPPAAMSFLELHLYNLHTVNFNKFLLGKGVTFIAFGHFPSVTEIIDHSFIISPKGALNTPST